ncbi:glycosyltransferase family 1 protein [Arthrobacter cheniae]|uniref:Glycosyltransferase family 1 protein n=1 Tax=Arthrobacter cheniae TaxID=1258888 RepID=A0A3A5M3Y3_9MICC|nr:glycosyltransferase [Arthrobacter cheniae]RJT81812.1 glycosyltransferase family 1 protein [Arthrobacter cheniae]
MQDEVIVLSHLRWDGVWQRPQQLISRLGRHRKIWFVEEPVTPPGRSVTDRRLAFEETGSVTRVWLEVPEQGRHVGYEDDVIPDYADQLPKLVGPPQGQRVVWLYTPLALDIAVALRPTTIVYDVMDDLASFKNAAPALVEQHLRTLHRADVVFAGGRSLHRAVVEQGRHDAEFFPSGVSPEHYAAARCRTADTKPKAGRSPVAGYVGVLDERLDRRLIADLAERLPEWEIRMIGPLAKLAPEQLPQASNITYLGQQDYEDLPRLMAEFDVALMPFALSAQTRSISPTKTLEYLACNLPVVSTRVPDVVSEFGHVVYLRDDAAGFADACQMLRDLDRSNLQPQLRRLLKRYHWDTIAERMAEHAFEPVEILSDAATVVEV